MKYKTVQTIIRSDLIDPLDWNIAAALSRYYGPCKTLTEDVLTSLAADTSHTQRHVNVAILEVKR